MKRLLLRALTGGIMVSLLGCEGYRVTKGTVVDKKTNRPLPGVLCEALEPNPYVLHNKALSTAEPACTDMTGAFQMHGELGGCLPECPDIVVRFSKEGYDTLQVKNPTVSRFCLMQHRD